MIDFVYGVSASLIAGLGVAAVTALCRWLWLGKKAKERMGSDPDAYSTINGTKLVSTSCVEGAPEGRKRIIKFAVNEDGELIPLSRRTVVALRNWVACDREGKLIVQARSKEIDDLLARQRCFARKSASRKGLSTKNEVEFTQDTLRFKTLKLELGMKTFACAYFLNDENIWPCLGIRTFLDMTGFLEDIFRHRFFVDTDEYLNHGASVLIDFTYKSSPDTGLFNFSVPIDREVFSKVLGSSFFGSDYCLYDFDKETRKQIALSFYFALAHRAVVMTHLPPLEDKKLFDLTRYACGPN